MAFNGRDKLLSEFKNKKENKKRWWWGLPRVSFGPVCSWLISFLKKNNTMFACWFTFQLFSLAAAPLRTPTPAKRKMLGSSLTCNYLCVQVLKHNTVIYPQPPTPRRKNNHLLISIWLRQAGVRKRLEGLSGVSSGPLNHSSFSSLRLIFRFSEKGCYSIIGLNQNLAVIALPRYIQFYIY